MDASNNNLNRPVEIFGTQVEVNTQVNQFTNTILISGLPFLVVTATVDLDLHLGLLVLQGIS